MKLQLTDGGKDCLLHCLEGEDPPVFSSIKYGNGSNAGTSATALSNLMKTIAITSITRATGSEFVKLTGTFSNASIQTRFRVTETGVFIVDPDDNTKEIMFAYGYVDEEESILVPAVTDYAFETTDAVMVYVGQTQNITAIISQSMTNVTKAEYDAFVARRDNPHQVTKEQVGLGNVPNVNTNGQTPTFDEYDPDFSESLDTLELLSGSSLSGLFKSLAQSVHLFISHLRNTNNPHGITANSINAAAKTHKHSATDITSGILPIARGGTGYSSLAELQAALISGTTDGMYKTGSYTGTGTYGSTNKNVITYTKKPKFVLVQPVTGTSGTDEGFLCLADVTTLYSGGFNDDVANPSSDLHFTWSGTQVSWYGQNATKQANKASTMYRYLVVY